MSKKTCNIFIQNSFFANKKVIKFYFLIKMKVFVLWYTLQFNRMFKMKILLLNVQQPLQQQASVCNINFIIINLGENVRQPIRSWEFHVAGSNRMRVICDRLLEISKTYCHSWVAHFFYSFWNIVSLDCSDYVNFYLFSLFYGN